MNKQIDNIFYDIIKGEFDWENNRYLDQIKSLMQNIKNSDSNMNNQES